LVGISRDKQQMFRPKEFSADPGGLYTVAITHGGGDPAVLQARGLHYWALGGRHDRNTPQSGPRSVHYCGSPQGRSPKETGVHGCTLVQVDEQQQSRISLIPTDAVRWVTEQVQIDDAATRESVETLFRERLHALSESARDLPLLISWKFSGKGDLASQLRRGNLASQWLDWLRTEFGHAQPALWSLSLDIELTDPVPLDWYEHETIRGDFLRAVRQLQMNTDEALGLENYVAESHLAGTLAESVANPDDTSRNFVLREAALLGVDLLSGEENPS
jgi:DNA repair exonuclease SbcCD nuclease subunit